MFRSMNRVCEMGHSVASMSRMLHVVALTVIVGCASTQAVPPYGHLGARLSAPAEVTLGDSAQFRLTVRNDSSSETRIELLLGGGRAFSPIVRQGNDTVWQCNRNQILVGYPKEARFGPGDSLTFTAVWPLTDNHGHAVSPGVYDVVAVLEDSVGHSIFGDGIKQSIRVNPR